MHKGKIIYVFPCGGKSFYCKINPRAIELKSEKYRWEDYIEGEQNKGFMNKVTSIWPQNYLDAIRDSVWVYDYVFITNSGRKLCQKYNLDYCLVFPYSEAKEEYIERMRKRGNCEAIVQNMMFNYEKYIRDLENDSYAVKKYRLSRGLYLSDIMEVIN